MNKAYKKPYTDLKKAVQEYLANTSDANALSKLVAILNTDQEAPKGVLGAAKS